MPDDERDAPTFDENGYLATVVVDAKKFTELTRELVILRRHNELLRAVAEAADIAIGSLFNHISIDASPNSGGYFDALQAAIDGGALAGDE